MRVFLIADASGRYAWVRISGERSRCIDRLEDAGCEVVEEQTDDYDGPVSEWEGTCTLKELTSPTSNFIPHD
jgi:hypothetical protein